MCCCCWHRLLCAKWKLCSCVCVWVSVVACKWHHFITSRCKYSLIRTACQRVMSMPEQSQIKLLSVLGYWVARSVAILCRNFVRMEEREAEGSDVCEIINFPLPLMLSVRLYVSFNYTHRQMRCCLQRCMDHNGPMRARFHRYALHRSIIITFSMRYYEITACSVYPLRETRDTAMLVSIERPNDRTNYLHKI